MRSSEENQKYYRCEVGKKNKKDYGWEVGKKINGSLVKRNN